MSVKLEIVVNNKPITVYTHKGKKYIEGRASTEYTLRITNNSFARVLVIPSVDGLSVINGTKASDKSEGYVVNGYQTLDIPGWLKSDKEVAKFIFGETKASYANQIGEGETNCGVIGAMVFHEKAKSYVGINTFHPMPYVHPTPYWNHITYGNATGAAPANTSKIVSRRITALGMNAVGMSSMTATLNNSDETSMGTGWGNTATFNTVKVEFEKQDNPYEIVALYYDSRRNLEKLGIKFEPEAKQPNPFPEYKSYCRAP